MFDISYKKQEYNSILFINSVTEIFTIQGFMPDDEYICIGVIAGDIYHQFTGMNMKNKAEVVSVVIRNEKSVLKHLFGLANGEWILETRTELSGDLKNNSFPEGNLIFINIIQKNEVLVVSKGFKQAVLKTGFFIEDSIFEIEEQIDSNGVICVEMAESNINKVLRAIYRQGKKHVHLCLLNSIYNSIHEKTISNLLQVVGYKVEKSSIDYTKIQ
ncbi:MAG: hypothetical protein JXA77_14020 [Bacteroidales bacterium]|nr:hypothetical protein [Bacteroidales bacterium]MBN2819220.1 hypothetical protein [Bacteroidales bacterium]